MTLYEAIYLANILDSFGAILSRRFERTRSINDLNYAIDVASMAVDATPQDYLDQAIILSNLRAHLRRRFERTGSMVDLNRAVDVASTAVDATPRDHPDRAGRLSNLGNHLSSRFERDRSTDDFDISLRLFQMGSDCGNAAPSIHISLARRAAILLASQGNWEESSYLLEGAVKLLSLISPQSLQHIDK